MRGVTTAFPLLLIPLFVYTFMAYTIGSGWVGDVVFNSRTNAGTVWTITGGDLFVWSSLALLFVETVKASATNSRAIMNHALSTVVLLAAFALFLTNAAFVTSPFFTLVLFALSDVVGGIVITIISARRDFDSSSGGVGILH